MDRQKWTAEEEAQFQTSHDHLHKLSAIKSEAGIEQLPSNLWKTRKTGLRSHEKSHFRSLLSLSFSSPLDPKCVLENLTADEILKLFPRNLPLDLQTNLTLLFHKYQSQWKQELTKDQFQGPVFRISSGQVFRYLLRQNSEILTPLWPHEYDLLGVSGPIISEVNTKGPTPLHLQHDGVGPSDNQGVVPCLKSMTWHMENRSLAPVKRVAIISLKLQDHTKSPCGEMEVKFQVTGDTLEAVLRSLAYINEQLSMLGASSGPVQKKQKQ